VTGELRQHLIAAETELGSPLPELRPALAGRAVPRRWIDEEEDAAGANRR
jgi:hypothetical protein